MSLVYCFENTYNKSKVQRFNNIGFWIILLTSGWHLLNLLGIPIFGDEALYLSLADKIRADPSSGLLSLQSGVMPLTIWVLAGLRSLLPFVNPLLLGRFLMAGADIVAAVLIYRLVTHLVNKKAGWLSMLIYLLLPLTFFHGRFVMLESLTNLFSLLAIYLVVTADRKKLNRLNLKFILLLGLAGALAFFTKPLAIVYLISIPIYLTTALIKDRRDKFFKMYYLNLSLAGGIFLLSLLIFYLPIAAVFHQFLSTGSTSELLLNFKINLHRMYLWSRVYLTLPIIFLSLISSILIIKTKKSSLFWVVLWMGAVILFDCLFSARFFPRHLYPLAILISILSGFLLEKLMRYKYIFAVVIILTFFQVIKFDLKLTINPQLAPIAMEDRQAFYEDWTAGVGGAEVASTLKQLSIYQKIVVFVENEPTQAWVFQNLFDTGNSLIIPSDDLRDGKFIRLSELDKYQNYPKYLILNRNPSPPSDWPVKLIYFWPKGDKRTINLYQII